MLVRFGFCFLFFLFFSGFFLFFFLAFLIRSGAFLIPCFFLMVESFLGSVGLQKPFSRTQERRSSLGIAVSLGVSLGLIYKSKESFCMFLFDLFLSLVS